jgi:hypothetical protein
MTLNFFDLALSEFQSACSWFDKFEQLSQPKKCTAYFTHLKHQKRIGDDVGDVR